MKMIAVVLLALAVSACTIVPDRRMDGRHRAGATPAGTELVCHKGKKTMELPASAVSAHLGHGDHRGRCH